MKTKTALMLCTGNSCRSQMAQVLSENYFPENWKIYSAGTEKHGLNENAVSCIKEKGYSAEHLHSKTLNNLELKEFDLVFSVCDRAQENCPYLPAKLRFHNSFDDPPRLAKDLDESESKKIYQRVFDEIEQYIKNEIINNLELPANKQEFQ